MGSVQGKPNAEQRGNAAHIRQKDDNTRQATGKGMLPQHDRQFCNKVIHDPDMNHTPKYDKPLDKLKGKHL